MSDSTIAPFLRNAWYVAAWPEEIGEAPLGRVIMNEPIVLFRGADGIVAALEDRCCHRFAPLSRGRLEGDELRCMYHGLKFGRDGRCTEIPGQSTIAERACVRTFAAVESGCWLWIWMGDQDAIDCDPPEVGYQTDPNWTPVNGYYEVAANWVLIRENVLDLTHIAFLHKKTFKQDDWITAPDTYLEGETICYEQEFDFAPLSPLFCAGMGLPEDKPIKRVQKGRMPSLAISFSDWNVHDPNPDEGRRSDFIVRGCHIVTPAQRGKTHYFWMAAFDVPSLTKEVAEKTRASVTAAFDEDKQLLEKLQASVAADPRGMGFLEVTLGADGAGIKVRQLLNKKLKAEGRSLAK